MMRMSLTDVGQPEDIVGTVRHDADDWTLENLGGKIGVEPEFADGEANPKSS